jgi:hypothetical protein
MGEGCGLARGARILLQWPDDLIIKQYSIPEGYITLPVEERNKHTHSYTSPLSDILDVRQQSESCIYGTI